VQFVNNELVFSVQVLIFHERFEDATKLYRINVKLVKSGSSEFATVRRCEAMSCLDSGDNCKAEQLLVQVALLQMELEVKEREAGGNEGLAHTQRHTSGHGETRTMTYTGLALIYDQGSFANAVEVLRETLLSARSTRTYHLLIGLRSARLESHWGTKERYCKGVKHTAGSGAHKQRTLQPVLKASGGDIYDARDWSYHGILNERKSNYGKRCACWNDATDCQSLLLIYCAFIAASHLSVTKLFDRYLAPVVCGQV
jgi:hypothetical protein